MTPESAGNPQNRIAVGPPAGHYELLPQTAPVICPSPSAAFVSPASAPKLLDRVRWHLRVKHYSIRTEAVYLDWIRRYILFHGKRHPNEMGETEIAAFLTHLAVNRNVAASTPSGS